MEFIGFYGEAPNVLQVEAKNRLNVVPPISDWCITQFDYNKDIAINDCHSGLQVTQWAAAYGRLQIRI